MDARIEQYAYIKNMEDGLIESHGLNLDRSTNNKTMSLANEIYPLLTTYNFDRVKRTTCSEEEIKKLFEPVADTLKIPNDVTNIPIISDNVGGILPMKSGVMRSGDYKPVAIYCEELVHLDMVPEILYQLLIAHQYFRFQGNRGVNYYESETLPYTTKHLSSKVVDSLTGNTNTSKYSLAESLDRLKKSIIFLNETKDTNFDRTGLLRAVRDYEFKYFSSILHGILTSDKYESNPEKVKYYFTDLFYKPNTSPTEFFKNIDVNIYDEDTPLVIEKKIGQMIKK